VRRIRAFGFFWWDFVVGDDWLTAAGVVLSIGVTALLVHSAGIDAWWLVPVAVAALLLLSLRRAARA
jgi:hypothetical protein